MKTIPKKTMYIAIGTLLLGFALGGLFFTNSSHDKTARSSASNSDIATIWTCSMHPQIRKNEHGDCPICGMELIPLENEHNSADPTAISMSANALKLAHIQTAIVGINQPKKEIQLYGKIQTDERLIVTQSAHIAGRIEKLAVNFTGEFVKSGQIIAYIYAPELITAQEELLEALSLNEIQNGLLDAAIEKLKNWKLSDSQIQELMANKQVINSFPVFANTSGYVSKKMLSLGDYVQQGQAIYEIADLSKVWLLLDVYETDLQWIQKGDQVSFQIKSIAGKNFNGAINYIDPNIDPKTRVAKARVELSNPNYQLKPEMLASATLQSSLINYSKNVIVIPKTAVLWTGKRSLVYVLQNKNTMSFLPREVILGPSLGDAYAIESGLQSGEEIAINGAFSIDAAAQLAGKSSMMNQNTEAKNSNKEQLSAENSQKIKLWIDAYLPLKNALIEGNAKSAQAYSANLLSTISKSIIQHDKTTQDEFNIYQKQLIHQLEQFNKFSKIDQQRKLFIQINQNLIELLTSINYQQDGLFIQHCPMVDNNTGADWLSIDKKILNPYYGDLMLNCGEINKQLFN